MPLTETEPIKKAIRRFWGNRPCGLIHSSQPVSTREFFRETEEHRFAIHTDWDLPFLKAAIGFEKHTGKQVLEIGSGIGVDALEWKRAGNQVIALDFNFPSCQLTRSRFTDAGAGGCFLNGDAENLPFPDESFDLIYSFGVLHHTPGTEKAVREIHRCLKPRGAAIIMLYYKWSAKVLGEILLGYGIRQRGLWRSGGVSNLISRYTEFDSQTSDSICPLTKVYSKAQIRKMFGPFRSVKIELHYLWPGHFGPFRRLLPLVPQGTKRSLHRRLGWNAIITASK